jgi:hypothetical protein
MTGNSGGWSAYIAGNAAAQARLVAVPGERGLAWWPAAGGDSPAGIGAAGA